MSAPTGQSGLAGALATTQAQAQSQPCSATSPALASDDAHRRTDQGMVAERHHHSQEQASGSQRQPTRLDRATGVLRTEAAAMANLARLYESDKTARESFDKAVETIVGRAAMAGKLVIVGVGKSGHIGRKLAAMLQSLNIVAFFLHPTEALHGDLGLTGPHDAFLFITFSGETPEILLMLSHLDPASATILITGHARRESCEFIRRRPETIFLPAPIPECENVSFGVSAPSTSTAVASALGDALAITVAHAIHPNVANVFAKNHPGGAIGDAARRPRTIKDLCIMLSEIPNLEHGLDTLAMDLLRLGLRSKSGWVKVKAEDAVISPTKIQKVREADICRPVQAIPGLITPRQRMICMASCTPISEAKCVLPARGCLDLDQVIGVVEEKGLVGVLEVRQFMGFE